MLGRLIAAILLVLVLVGGLTTPVIAQPETATVTINALNCPDSASSGRNFDSSQCEPGYGIAFTLTSEDGTVLGNCVASELSSGGTAAGCAISGVPYETTVVVSQDSTTLPANVEPDPSNSISLYTSVPGPSSNLTVVFFNRLVVETAPTAEPIATAAPSEVPTAGNPASSPGPSVTGSASAPPATGGSTEGSNATVVIGTCDNKTFEEPVAELTDVIAPVGDLRGATNASAVETSFTTIDLSLDDLTSDDHIIVVFDQDAPDTALACGAVGGIVAEDGSLAIGLRAQGDSRFTGVAYLAPSGEGTAVSIFLAENLAGEQDGN